ncbi:auxilin-like protein SWA2 [Sporobolomyces salmoneus]|uniref:auxilin-like protein SWA2 n=1 Tax=Sporobolomyces salmoneus TaxID=183962 RepID=UPI00317CCF0A
MDDLLDLDFSKPSLSTAKTSSQATYGSGRSAFDYLAKSSAPPPPRTTTPLNGGVTRSTTPLQPQTQSKPNSSGARGGGDAFAGLFGSNTSSSNSNKGNGNGNWTMSMAERLAKERTASPAFGFGAPSATSRSSSPALQPPRSTPSPALPQTRPSQTPPIRSNAPSPASVLLPSRPASSTSNSTAPKKPTQDPWDFDLLSTTVPTTFNPPNLANSVSAKTEDPFDLGFDAPSTSTTSQQEATDDFDLLGAFSQPAKPPSQTPSPSQSQPSPEPSAQPRPSKQKPNGTFISPPPELLLKLTSELGFALPAANQALISTFERTGAFGIEDAVELLMTQGERIAEGGKGRGKGKGREKTRDVDEWGEEENVRVGRRRSWEFEDQDEDSGNFEAERRRRKQQQQQQSEKTTEGVPSRRKAGPTEEGQKDSTELDQTAKVLQDQASEVLAQAQKIGFSMFKSANAYWGAGKEALAKKLEEQRKAARVAAGLPPGVSATTNGGGGGEGKPKWWKEGMDLEEEGPNGTKRNGKGKAKEESSGFKDSDDEDTGPESVLPQRPTSTRPPPHQTSAPSNLAAAPSPTPSSAEYRSPFRRAKPSPTPSAAPEADLLSSGSTVSSQPPPPRSVPSPVARSSRPSPTPAASLRPPAPRRPVVSILPSALSSAITHKSHGNSHFKLGRFSDASSSYTLALKSLPPQWIGRVILLNNRAQSRLKSGEEKGAVEDCTESLEILLSPYTEGRIDRSALAQESEGLGKEVKELAGGTVDLRDQLGKSLARRAKGYEVMEKWNLALKDWEQLRKVGDEVVVRGAGGGKLVGDGVARCRKVLDPSPPARSTASTSTSTSAPSRPRPVVPRTKRPEIQGSGLAVKALQATQAAQLAEDDLRLELKDSVDSRILAWKGSKETNLRALIASLDSVLWPELGWKKVGMHELISEGQLKVKYVRAIAKVHPDKLNVGNTTVEQRMIAGAVFATLNEAWNSTQA